MDVQFVLPTTAALTAAEQRTLLVNQAAAVIISAYLDHAARINQTNPNAAFQFTAAELVALVNDVQAALSTF